MSIMVGDISQQTVEAVKALLGQPPLPYLPQGVRKNITQATGLTAYDLEPAAKTLVPAITPVRNLVPRVKNTRGGTAVNWKTITGLDIGRNDIFTAEGAKAATVSYSVNSVSAAFATISKGDNLSFQADWAGKNFEDVKSTTVTRLLKHVMIHEEQAMLGGRVAALGTVTTPTTGTATTGGTIAIGTYYVVCRAVTNLSNSYTGGTSLATLQAGGATSTSVGKKSAQAAVTTTSATSTITATVPAVSGASSYEWYVGTVNDSVSEKLEAITTINSVNLTALLGTGNAVAADNSANALAFDGMESQLDKASAAQIRTLATGTAGTGTTMSLNDINQLLKSIWDVARANPDVMLVSSQESVDLTALVLAAAGAPTLFVARNDEKADVAAGYRVPVYINPVTGKRIPIITHPYMTPGKLYVLTLEMPFPASDIVNPIEMETRQEYYQLDYPLIAPKWEWEVLVDELLKFYFPGSCGVLRNIAPKNT